MELRRRAHGALRESPPVQQASCRLAVKKGHGQVHDPCQQVPVQLLAGAEAAQHQQQGPDNLQEQSGGCEPTCLYMSNRGSVVGTASATCQGGP